MEDEEIRVRATVDARPLDKMKITVHVTLTTEEWIRFAQHCEKTGNEVARKVAEQSKEMVEKIKQARKLLTN